MPRRNRVKGNGYCQKSKRSRAIRKMAIFSGLDKNFSHSSHISGTQRVLRSIGYTALDKKTIKKILKGRKNGKKYY